MSQTLTQGPGTGPRYRASRSFDFLYDPLYTLSSEKDHAHATLRAHMSHDRVQKLPEFPSMFSELLHQPPFTLRLHLRDPVPQFIERRWRGRGEHRLNAPSQSLLSSGVSDNAEVTGRDRYKYSERPLVPFSQPVPPGVLLAVSRAEVTPCTPRPVTPLLRTVGIQTDYRDSEAQTDPYSPEYVVRPGSVPELLMLANLTWGCGLPAGLAEVEMIERAREKRAWEAALPPLSDLSQLQKRRKMMDEQERKEWSFREQEIERLQAARLEVLKKLLQTRTEKQEELDRRRLDGKWTTLQTDREERMRLERAQHIQEMRKLVRRMGNVEGRLERRDVIQDYRDYASQTYAPLTRIANFPDRLSEHYKVKSPFLDSYQGLLELEANLPDFVTQPRIRSPKHRTTTKDGFPKRQAQLNLQMKQVHEALLEQKSRRQQPQQEKPLRFLQKIEKPVPRPSTPSVPGPLEGEEERELATIFLQSLIRGRAVQNMMYEGKERRLELIGELRATHALQEEEQLLKREEKRVTLALQRQRQLHQEEVSRRGQHLSWLEGGVLCDMFDFLSKELVRLQEERRVHAFAMLAERHRRTRQAEESGRRQEEERRRREEDEVFRQVVQVHQSTVDAYLEDIILRGAAHTAEEQAREEIARRAREINDIAYQMEDRRTRGQSEEIVAELVYSFLIPETQRRSVRERVRNSQQRHLQAAHRVIHTDTETLLNQSPGRNQDPADPEPGEKPRTC